MPIIKVIAGKNANSRFEKVEEVFEKEFRFYQVDPDDPYNPERYTWHTVIFRGTKKEIEVAERWPSFVSGGSHDLGMREYGQNLIRRFVNDPVLEAWETFCCGE
jgi:hypothetical protein